MVLATAAPVPARFSGRRDGIQRFRPKPGHSIELAGNGTAGYQILMQAPLVLRFAALVLLLLSSASQAQDSSPMEQGRALLKARKFQEAIAQFNQAIADNAENAEA